MMTTSAGPGRRQAGAPARLAFLAWMVAGATVIFGVLTLFTIGIFVLPAGVLLTLALALWPATRNRSATGLITGAGLLPLYVAYLNRGGPGTVCTTTATSQTCMDEWSPWPWLAAGLTLVLAGLALFAYLGRSARLPD